MAATSEAKEVNTKAVEHIYKKQIDRVLRSLQRVDNMEAATAIGSFYSEEKDEERRTLLMAARLKLLRRVLDKKNKPAPEPVKKEKKKKAKKEPEDEFLGDAEFAPEPKPAAKEGKISMIDLDSVASMFDEPAEPEVDETDDELSALMGNIGGGAKTSASETADQAEEEEDDPFFAQMQSFGKPETSPTNTAPKPSDDLSSFFDEMEDDDDSAAQDSLADDDFSALLGTLNPKPVAKSDQNEPELAQTEQLNDVSPDETAEKSVADDLSALFADMDEDAPKDSAKNDINAMFAALGDDDTGDEATTKSAHSNDMSALFDEMADADDTEQSEPEDILAENQNDQSVKDAAEHASNNDMSALFAEMETEEGSDQDAAANETDAPIDEEPSAEQENSPTEAPAQTGDTDLNALFADLDHADTADASSDDEPAQPSVKPDQDTNFDAFSMFGETELTATELPQQNLDQTEDDQDTSLEDSKESPEVADVTPDAEHSAIDTQVVQAINTEDDEWDPFAETPTDHAEETDLPDRPVTDDDPFAQLSQLDTASDPSTSKTDEDSTSSENTFSAEPIEEAWDPFATSDTENDSIADVNSTESSNLPFSDEAQSSDEWDPFADADFDEAASTKTETPEAFLHAENPTDNEASIETDANAWLNSDDDLGQSSEPQDLSDTWDPFADDEGVADDAVPSSQDLAASSIEGELADDVAFDADDPFFDNAQGNLETDDASVPEPYVDDPFAALANLGPSTQEWDPFADDEGETDDAVPSSLDLASSSSDGELAEDVAFDADDTFFENAQANLVTDDASAPEINVDDPFAALADLGPSTQEWDPFADETSGTDELDPEPIAEEWDPFGDTNLTAENPFGTLHDPATATEDWDPFADESTEELTATTSTDWAAFLDEPSTNEASGVDPFAFDEEVGFVAPFAEGDLDFLNDDSYSSGTEVGFEAAEFAANDDIFTEFEEAETVSSSRIEKFAAKDNPFKSLQSALKKSGKI